MPKKTSLKKIKPKNKEEENNPFKRISKPTAVLMVCVAILYELTEAALDALNVLVPGLGLVLAFFVDIVALMHFWLWFKLRGVNLGSPKALARFWLFNLAEFLPIPVLDTGLLLIGIILTISMTWVEDKTGIKVPGKAKKSLK